MLKQNSNIFLAFLVAFDFVFLFFAYFFSRYLVFSKAYFSTLTPQELIVTFILIILFFITLERFEISHSYRFRPISSIIKNIVIYELFIIALFYLCILFKIYIFDDRLIFYFISITFVFFLAERVFIKIFLNILRRIGFNYKRYLIVGAGILGVNFYEKTSKNIDLGIKIIGFLDDNPHPTEFKEYLYNSEIKKMILGTTDNIEKIIKTYLIDNVIIALPMRAEEKIIDLVNTCEKYGAKAELIPDYYKIISNRPSIRQIENYPLIGVRNAPLENMFNRLIKRMLDVLLSTVGLLFLSPFFIIIMSLIKLTSKGPVFFKQIRTGYKQKDFYIYKFRSMKVNDNSDKIQATKDDPRKTAFGDFLRRTNIDELPQLINILKGDMSVVGPRPHMLAHTEEFYQKYDKYHVRHWVKPGLTGWAQVNGWRGDSDIGIRVKYDIDYIENWSIFLDIKIIFLTVFGKKVKRNAV